ncbi:hypothetical protein CGC50_10890 [Capnocytophaga gingivalis]|uniref:Teneurin-like YD-shell domain-containing protein n=1 Tax=Capnocytophaga gingivalis TaxID=1017 RepID=A0A250FRI6_9FLAO|nr:RHS repeat-associated core domain-containing protein [Capnocytophaga gingivalis]ATA87611.1 hypothetical protein CGC50_10890 [Capnocytophaga gingivalis]
MRHQTARSDYGTLLWKEYQWGVDYRLYDIIDHAYKDRDASFEYDDRGYLVRAIYDRKEEQFRTPDKLGNLYETKDKKDRKYKNSQLQQDRTYYYHYDVEGNLIFKEHIKDVGYRPVFSGGELRDLGIQPKSTGKGILYTWNANGSLRSVTDLQGTTYRFRYDAFGRRLEKRRMSSTFRFVWDGNVLLHETFKKDNSENTELTTWVFEGFVPTAKLVNDKAYSIISDHLGTPILAIDSDGMEVWNRQLDIYGRVRKEYKHSSLGNDVFPFVPFLYQGQYYDFETNLAYNRYRYYSPESGMYISQDPIKLLGSTPNIYMYVKDPNISIDIWGLDSRKLDRALGGKNGDGMAAHHLIPETVYNKYSAFFNAIGVERDDAKNGLLMPSSAKKATELGDPAMIVHCGGHPDYINEVETKVKDIKEEFAKEDLTKEEIRNKAVKKIRELQEELRKDILNKKKGVKKTKCGGSNTLA